MTPSKAEVVLSSWVGTRNGALIAKLLRRYKPRFETWHIVCVPNGEEHFIAIVIENFVFDCSNTFDLQRTKTFNCAIDWHKGNEIVKTEGEGCRCSGINNDWHRIRVELHRLIIELCGECTQLAVLHSLLQMFGHSSTSCTKFSQTTKSCGICM